MNRWCLAVLAAAAPAQPWAGEAPARSMQFHARTPDEARVWQRSARRELCRLFMGGGQPDRVPLAPKVLRREENLAGAYVMQEITLQSLPDRRVHAWMALPSNPKGRVGAVLALHGHGGSGEQVVRGQGLYWYGRALAEMGYVVIAPDIGSHDLQHPGWTLMGERVWDAIRCVDYLATLPRVDAKRIAVAGLSLGGETAMHVAALDERVRAVCSSGWLTTVANMKQGHCPCWNAPGLEERFDFADIFACIAPRALVCEVGALERAPGGFPLEIARPAFQEVLRAYRVLGAEDRAALDAHPYGHVFVGREFWGPLRGHIGTPSPWRLGTGAGTEELLRRGEIARRAFLHARGVLEGWWALRDPETQLFPRRTDQPVWAPQDNAADMLPFLILTARWIAPEREPEVLRALESERAVTNRLGVLPDWWSLKDRGWAYRDPDLTRILFNAAEYCKDGILPLLEALGDGPWAPRMAELLEAVFQRAPVRSGFGPLPSGDMEVNGDLLQALSRFYTRTGDERYWEWSARIADAYCLEVLPKSGGLPPHHWDFLNHVPIRDETGLNDHANEIIGGLVEAYVVGRARHPERAAKWREPLARMFARLLERARNADGLWVSRLRASTAEVLDPRTPDTWGYALGALAAFARAAGEPSLEAAARKALGSIDRPAYLDWQGADSYADSIEGALLVLNRFRDEEARVAPWLEKVLPLFLSRQRDDGIVEGWYGDGNYARTALMAALYCTQGARCEPWRPDLRLGAVRQGEVLRLALSADSPWEGRIVVDGPRHREHLRLPVNYPRLNEFPEWFTVEADSAYAASVAGHRRQASGRELRAGLSVHVSPGRPLLVEIRPARPPGGRSVHQAPGPACRTARGDPRPAAGGHVP